jgi:hypothetical protein
MIVDHIAPEAHAVTAVTPIFSQRFVAASAVNRIGWKSYIVVGERS